MAYRMMGAVSCALLSTLASAGYRVEILSRPTEPLVSWANPVGHGHSPFEKTFNPSYLPPSGEFTGGLLVRLANTSKTTEHIGFVPCDFDTATGDVSCKDLDTSFEFAPTSDAEDPRAFLYDGWYYNFFYANKAAPGDKCVGPRCSVRLAKTQTPLSNTSWQHITTLPWHRNGCCIRRSAPPHFCIFGEGSSKALEDQYPKTGPWPMPGLGMATTESFDSGEFKQVNWTADNPSLLGLTSAASGARSAVWLDSVGAAAHEAKLEAGAHPMQLSTGDYIFFTSGPDTQQAHVANGNTGNYSAGYLILDKDNPTKVLQRNFGFLTPKNDFESLCHGAASCPFKGEREWTIFLCSAVATQNKDEFRLFWGGGDGSVGTGLVRVLADGSVQS